MCGAVEKRTGKVSAGGDDNEGKKRSPAPRGKEKGSEGRESAI